MPVSRQLQNRASPPPKKDSDLGPRIDGFATASPGTVPDAPIAATRRPDPRVSSRSLDAPRFVRAHDAAERRELGTFAVSRAIFDLARLSLRRAESVCSCGPRRDRPGSDGVASLGPGQ